MRGDGSFALNKYKWRAGKISSLESTVKIENDQVGQVFDGLERLGKFDFVSLQFSATEAHKSRGNLLCVRGLSFIPYINTNRTTSRHVHVRQLMNHMGISLTLFYIHMQRSQSCY